MIRTKVNTIPNHSFTKYFSYIYKSLGDAGSHLYVSSQGEYEVIKDGKILGRLGMGKAFGELAILYNCKRTASIKGIAFIIIMEATILYFE